MSKKNKNPTYFKNFSITDICVKATKKPLTKKVNGFLYIYAVRNYFESFFKNFLRLTFSLRLYLPSVISSIVKLL